MGQGRSRITLKNLQARNRKFPSVNSDVLMCIGVFPWGPMHQAQVVTDFGDFVDKYGIELYGPFMDGYESGIQVKNFFDMGGRRAVIVRVAHLTAYLTGTTLLSAAKGTVTLVTDGLAPYGLQNTLTLDALYYGTRPLYAAVQAASNGEASRFDLLIYETGVSQYLEWFRNVTMDTTDPLYVEDVVNTIGATRSLLVRATDETASGSATQRRPINISPATLTGGNEGLTLLDDNDFIGAAAHNTGVYAFNLEAEGDMLISPDKITTAAQNALTAWCGAVTGRNGKALYYLESPASTAKAGVVAHAQALTASEDRTAVYWPHVQMVNPLKSLFGAADYIEVSPVGMICGRVALNSQTEKQAQGCEPVNEVYGLLNLATGLEGTTPENIRHEVLSDGVQDYVTDYGVIPIISGLRGIDNNFGVWVNDTMLGKLSGNWVSVGQGHLLTKFRREVSLYMERHRGQGMTEERRREQEGALGSYFLQWLPRDVFASQDADEAFYVDTDPKGESLNNPLIRMNLTSKVLIGLALAEPGRFIEIIFTKDDRGVQSFILQQLAANG